MPKQTKYKTKAEMTPEVRGWLDELSEFQEADRDQRENAREADRFLLEKDGQWEESIARTLDSQKRPRYTFDQTTPAVEFIMSEIEGMQFGVNVKPHSGGADKDGALLREDIIRTIENDSQASTIYRKAARRMIRRGYDAWMVKADYADPWSFEQDLQVVAIPNAINRVWVSSTATELTSADADTAYVLTSMSPEDYKQQFPNGSGVSVSDADSYEEYDVYKPQVITIADRYYKKSVTVEVAQLSNGDVVELNEENEAKIAQLALAGVTVARTKKVNDFRVYHCRFDGGGKLSDERATVFKSCPVVTLYGNMELTGESSKRIYSGIVEKLIDYQRVLNYGKSREVEEGALAPREKYWMTKKQAAGHQDQLSSMNVSADPVQFYNPDPEAPAPYKGGPSQPNVHLNALGSEMSAGIQITAGVNNAMSGQYAGRMSEDALKMQIDRGVGTTKKWVNALAEAIRRTGDLLINALPEVYDTKREMMLLGMDGAESMAVLNDEQYNGQAMQKLNNLNQGKYKVFCDAGPAFSNRLEAGRDALLAYAAIDPTVVQEGGDIILKTIDAPLVDKLAERKRAQMLAAGMIPPEQMTEEEQAQMAQAAQQPKPPEPAMVLAEAEMLKAQADMLEQQNKQAELQVKVAEVQRKGYETGINERKTAADIAKTNAQTMKTLAETEKVSGESVAQQLDNIEKVTPTVEVAIIPQ